MEAGVRDFAADFGVGLNRTGIRGGAYGTSTGTKPARGIALQTEGEM